MADGGPVVGRISLMHGDRGSLGQTIPALSLQVVTRPIRPLQIARPERSTWCV